MTWRTPLIFLVLGLLAACSQPVKPAAEAKPRAPATPAESKPRSPAVPVEKNIEGTALTLRAVATAYLKGDTTAMSELFTEDFTLTNSTGEITTRRDEIENAQSGAVRYQVFEHHDMAPRLYGDAAVVVGRMHVKGQAGLDFFDAEFEFTDTLVWQGGRWHLAATHVSRLKSELKRNPEKPQEQH